jgi:V8-like Glu-specific endopeptidase
MPFDASDETPLSATELVEQDDACVSEDLRPWGMVTESANSVWVDSGADIAIERSRLLESAWRLRSSDLLHVGLPVLEANAGEAIARPLSVRRELAEERRLHGRAERVVQLDLPIGEAFCPDGVPQGRHPKLLPRSASRFGLSSRGNRTVLSGPHSTIINGESRSLVYPDRYPYTAVCKLYLRYQPKSGGPWQGAGEATGYLIGKSTLMTSGHVTPPTDGKWQIQVIPACWNGTSVFGPGMVSYVRGFWSWNSDSGNDIKICQLYDPIGTSLGYFGYKVYQSRWEDQDYWTMAGYPYDISLVSMSRETAIAVRDDDDGDDINVNGTTYDTTQVESDADEASGVSGAPLWGWWTKGPYAIGVHHGVERDGTISGTEVLSCAAGGDGFVAAAHWGRSMWG